MGLGGGVSVAKRVLSMQLKILFLRGLFRPSGTDIHRSGKSHFQYATISRLELVATLQCLAWRAVPRTFL